MAIFYFETDGGFVTVNGALAEQGFRADKDFALAYFREGRAPVFAKMASHPRKKTDGVKVCDLGGDAYLLSFRTRALRLDEPEVICQTVCRADNVSHLITSCRRGDFFLIAETSAEIQEFSCPCALNDIKAVAVHVSGGQILRITAKAERRKFAAVVFYGYDYLPLFSGVYDNVYFDGADVVYVERLGGCNDCVRTTRLCYSDGRFEKKQLSFTYGHDHLYPDELLPYLLVEKLKFGDLQGAEELLRRGLDAKAVLGTLGEFDEAADFPFLPYRPFVVGVYKSSDLCKVRYFAFDVRDGVICDVYPA